MKETKVNQEILDAALAKLAPNADEKTRETIRQYIEKKVSEIGTCVIYRVSPKANTVMSKLGISLGTRELIVYPNSLLYSDNYTIPPHLIKEVYVPKMISKRQQPKQQQPSQQALFFASFW